MEKECVLYILTASELTDERQLRFMDELASTALEHTDKSVRILHHISYHSRLSHGYSDLFSDRYERLLYVQGKRMCQMDHLAYIMEKANFSDDSLLLFCDDDDYFLRQIPLPEGDIVGYQGKQIIPEGGLFDGSPESLLQTVAENPCPEWYEAIDFSGYVMRASLAKQYFANRTPVPFVPMLEDTQFMSFVDPHLKVPDNAFVMHRLWQSPQDSIWKTQISDTLGELWNSLEKVESELEMIKAEYT